MSLASNARTVARVTSANSEAPVGRMLPLVICLLIVGGSVSWRQGVYFSGGLDPVVIAKAAIAGMAVLLCVHARLGATSPHPVGSRTVMLLSLFVVVSTFGGWAAGDAVSSVIVAVRVAMVAAAAYLLVRTYAPDVLLRSLFTAMAMVGGLAVATGLLAIGSTGGRLQGGIPPLAANEIALLCGAPALALIWRTLVHRGRRFDPAVIVLLLGAVWLSESRTGLAALLVGATIMVLQARRMPPGVVAIVIAAVSGAIYLMLTTTLVSSYFERSDEGSVTTLNSRTIAWDAAFDLPQTAYQWWMGGGLALKRIPVQGQYWNEQGLDSSWVSAWVQGGLICVLLLLFWVVSVFVASWRTPQPYRMLLTAILLFQIIRSFLESGLIDATPSFFLFMIMSLLAESGTRSTLLAAIPTSVPVPGLEDHRDPVGQNVSLLPSRFSPDEYAARAARSAGIG